MKYVFGIIDTAAQLRYIEAAAPAVFERVRRELLEEKSREDVFRNVSAMHRAVDEAFEASGCEAVMDTTWDGVPVLLRYMTTEKQIQVSGRYKVVGNRCFSRCPAPERIVFEEGVEEIHNRLAEGKSTLKSVEFPASLRYIGNNAFENCENLEEVVFRNPDTRISPDAFAGTKWFDRFADTFVVINGQLLKYNGKGKRVVIPEGVKMISHGVFAENGEIEQVVCPSTLEEIGAYPFENCVNLRRIDLGDKLKEVGPSAFWGCVNLKAVQLPRCFECMGADAFSRYTIIRFYDTDPGLTRHIRKTYPMYSGTRE